jgi:hypothetical protein
MEHDSLALPPELERRFESGVNKAIVTLPGDGGGISPIEMKFGEGEVTFRIMGGSASVLDIRRDPGIAIHCPTSVRAGGANVLALPAGPASWQGWRPRSHCRPTP